MSDDISKLRKNYQTTMLEKSKVKDNPFEQFELWFNEACEAEFIEPNAMSIATNNKDGVITSRMVLLKAFNKNGFVFFTNYHSNKAKDLDATKTAALNIWWDKLYRQVRIQGTVEKISTKESEEYFHTRPRGSQLGAIASQQSSVIDNYQVLENEYNRLEQKYEGKEIPYPKHWGGYRVIPNLIEFWQGRPNRLHDRLRYVTTNSNKWRIERVSP